MPQNSAHGPAKTASVGGDPQLWALLHARRKYLSNDCGRDLGTAKTILFGICQMFLNWQRLLKVCAYVVNYHINFCIDVSELAGTSGYIAII